MKTGYYVVHDSEGRILALVPKAAVAARHGVQVGWRPVAGINQFIADVQLTAAYARMTPHELIEQCAIRLDTKNGAATLHRRTVRFHSEEVSQERGSIASSNSSRLTLPGRAPTKRFH